MIPKIIHYCWFGRGKKPELAEKCIASWKKYLPNYQIIEWNEDNTDIEHEITYVQEAYNAKKYAFVSDYIRLKALRDYGGIYFDTDYEIIKPIDSLIASGSLVTGFESSRSILTAMIAVEKENPIIDEFVSCYNELHFKQSDGSFDMTPINVRFSRLLEKYGVDLEKYGYQNINMQTVIYPVEVLCGFDVENWHEKITENTYGVHHMSNSWATPEMKKHVKRIQFWQKILGYDKYDRLKNTLKKLR